MSIANVLLEITGDSRSAQKELDQVSRELAVFGRETAEASAKLDTDSARHALTDLSARLAKFGAEDVSAQANVKIARATAEIASLQALLDKIDHEDVTVDVKVRQDLTNRITALAAGIGDIGSESQKTHGAVTDLNQGFGLMGRSVGLIKWPALITGAGFAARALSTLLGGATALGSALATGLAGGIVAYANAYLALGQAVLTVKLAQLSDIQQALQGNTQAMKRLTPAAKDFVGVLQGFKPQFDALRKVVQENLFGGLTKGLNAAMGNFGVFKDVLGGTAKALGDLGEKLGKLVGSDSFGHLLSRVGQENTDILKRLGDAAINLAPAFFQILDAARPLVDWITKGIDAWSKNAAALVDNAHKTGTLTTFFQEAKHAIEAVVKIGGNLIHALINIGSAGRSTGMDLLHWLGRAAAQFAEWTSSASGQNTLQKYFQALEPPLKQTFKLVGELLQQFFKLGHGTDLTGLIKTLRTDLLPTLVQLIKGTTSAFGPKLIDLLVQWSQVLLKLAGSSGPLTLYVQGLTTLGKVLNFIFDTIPGVKSGTVDLIAAFALFKTVQGPISMISGLTSTLQESRLAVAAMPKVLAAYDTAVELAGGATKLAVASTGIGALIVVAVLIATHWSQTKQILAGIWNWLKGAAMAAGNYIHDHWWFALINPTIYAIAHWKDLKNFFVGVWEWMKAHWRDLAEAAVAILLPALAPAVLVYRYWKDIKDFLTGVWDDLKGAARDTFGAIKDAILTPIRAAQDTLGNIWDAIKNTARDAWNTEKGIAHDVWGAISSAITDPIHAAKGVLANIWGAIKSAAKATWGGIKSVAKDMWGGIKTAILTPIHAARSALGDVWKVIKSIANDAWHGIKDAAAAVWGAIKGVIVSPIRDAYHAIKDVLDSIKNAVKGALSWVQGALGTISNIYNKVIGVVNKVKEAISSIPGNGGNILNKIIGDLPGFPGPIQLSAIAAPAVNVGVAPMIARPSLAGVGGTSYAQSVTVTPLASGEYPDARAFAAQLAMALRARGGYA